MSFLLVLLCPSAVSYTNCPSIFLNLSDLKQHLHGPARVVRTTQRWDDFSELSTRLSVRPGSWSCHSSCLISTVLQNHALSRLVQNFLAPHVCSLSCHNCFYLTTSCFLPLAVRHYPGFWPLPSFRHGLLHSSLPVFILSLNIQLPIPQPIIHVLLFISTNPISLATCTCSFTYSLLTGSLTIVHKHKPYSSQLFLYFTTFYSQLYLQSI